LVTEYFGVSNTDRQEIGMRDLTPVKQAVNETFSRLFSHVRVCDVQVREDTDFDGEDILRIDVIYEGVAKDLDGKKLAGFIRHLRPRRNKYTNPRCRCFPSFRGRISTATSVFPLDLLDTAHDLVSLRSGRPKQGHLRRSISSAYYAMFHALMRCCADLLIGGSGSNRSKPAWSQVYRALDHGAARSACSNETMIAKFPREIQDFSNAFVQLQSKRHQATMIRTKRCINPSLSRILPLSKR
jgi:hypothetical protein